MTATKLFPYALCAMYLGASVVYAWHGDWRRCVYFAAALVLNLTIIW